jgi:peptide-methionine (R)-S-oxide reductase
MIARRYLFMIGGTFGLVAAGRAVGWAPAAQADNAFAVHHSDEEWRALLTPDQYAVLRQSATERSFTSPLLDEHRRGDFICAGCALALFSSTTKFDSGTGWPSFWAPLDKAVGTEEDRAFGMSRTAVYCSQCGGHLGHVFTDGPPPTGLRYCMNGVAMLFRPVTA